jgi:hypothetical protein
MEPGRLQAEKQQISDKLNSYVQLREYLPQNVREILCKTRAALESKSDENGESSAVKELETALGMPETQSSEDIHDSADGKFGDKTYDALINYIEKSLKDSVEIDPKKITVKLR